MDQHQRRIYALAAELGDLEVRRRQLEMQLELVATAMGTKYFEIEAAMRLRASAIGPLKDPDPTPEMT